MIQWGSHQSVFIQLIESHVLRHGLTVGILPSDDYAGGFMVRSSVHCFFVFTLRSPRDLS